MAVVSKHVSSTLRLADADDKTIRSYQGIVPSALPGTLNLFSEAVGEIRGEAVGSTFLTVTSELEEI